MRTVLAGLALVAASLGSAGKLRALGPIDVEVAARAGVGTNPVGGGLPNPLDFGAGGRAGVSVLDLYAGLSATYYVGQSGRLDVSNFAEIARGSISPHSLLLGGELGYSFELAHLVILRPQIGIGDDILGIGGSLVLGCRLCNMIIVARAVQTTQYLYLEPGLTALVKLGKLFAGVDVNALFLPAGPITADQPPPFATAPFTGTHRVDEALTAHAQIGVRF